MKKYLLDTSAIVHDPDILSNLEKSKIVIPVAVLEELDKLKSQFSLAGANARQFLKILDRLDITNSVTLENESVLNLDVNDYGSMGSDKSYGDNKILACAVALNKEFEIILLSKDYNLRIRARAYGVKAEDYSKDTIASNSEDFYTGTKDLEMSAEDIESFYKNGILCLDAFLVKKYELFPNQFLILRNEETGKSAACRFYEDMTLRPLAGINKTFGLSTKNKEQTFALDLLFDDSVKLVTLSGMAGTGKTLLAIAAGLQQVLEEKKYEKLFLIKSAETVGKDIGALPGTKLEKMAPFVQSIMDNVSFLMNKTKKKIAPKRGGERSGGGRERRDGEVINDPYLSLLVDRGIVEIESIAYLRGRSISNAFIIIDELQNMNHLEAKTILTRVGEGSKIICTGDLDQIDTANLNMFNCALTHVSERFKPYSIAGHVMLTKGERSELATLASKVL